MPKISENIVFFRKKNGVSQAELAEKLYVTPQAVSRWERGETEPDLETIQRIADIFQVGVEELVSGESNPARVFEKRLRLVYLVSSVVLFVFSMVIVSTTWWKTVPPALYTIFFIIAAIYSVSILVLETVKFHKFHQKESSKSQKKKGATKDEPKNK